MSKYLVTGGLGFIGSALCNRLLADGHEVVAFDDMSRGNANRLTTGTRTVKGDIRDYRALAKAAQGCDTILHLAYVQGTQTFYEAPKLVVDVAARGIINVLEVCEKQGIGNLMLMSSSEAYQVADKVPTDETVALSIPDPLNPRYSYGGGKAWAEVMCNAYHRAGVLDRLTIPRAHNIYGPDMGREHVVPEFALRMKKLNTGSRGTLEFPIQGSGLETRSFCFITDCVDALMLLLEADSGIYHVGTQDERTIRDVAHAVAQCFGRTVQVMPGTLPKGSPPRRCPDTSKLEALGYAPKISFDDGIRRAVEWYKHNP